MNMYVKKPTLDLPRPYRYLSYIYILSGRKSWLGKKRVQRRETQGRREDVVRYESKRSHREGGWGELAPVLEFSLV